MTTTLSSFVSADQLPNPATITTRLETVNYAVVYEMSTGAEL